MIKMIRRLQAARDQEQGAALIVAVILLIILAGLVSIMTLTAVNAMKSSIAVRDVTYFDLATSTAISDALDMANNPKAGESLDKHIGLAAAVRGDVAGNDLVKWQWYLRPVNASFAGLSYDIVATGYRGTPTDPISSRTVIARLVSFPTDGARQVGDTVFYRPTPSSIYSWGVFGANGATIGGTTKIRSFNSGNGSLGNNAVLGSNELINISAGASAPRILMTNSYPGHTSTERCTGSTCLPKFATEATYGMDTSVVNEWINSECPADTYPNVDGSAITIKGGEANCFNNVSLSGNVNVTTQGPTPSSGAPAKIYIKGNLNVAPGTRFNSTANNSVSGAMIYHMFVGGDSVSIGSSGATSQTRTDFRALVAASKATCSVGSPAAGADFWGALVCGNVSTAGDSIISWDEQTGQITGDVKEPRRIWNVTSYSNAP